MFTHRFADFFGLDGRTVVVDSSAEVSRFSNILLLTNPATDEINAVICLTGKIAQNFVAATYDGALKTVCVAAVFTEKTSSFRTSFKASVRQRVVQLGSHHHIL